MNKNVTLAIDIEADAATVYRAITTEEGERSFWTADCSVPMEEGATARFGFEAAPVDLELSIDTLKTDERAEWTPLEAWPHWQGTHISWDLSPSDQLEGTVVTFQHTGFSDEYADVELGRIAMVWANVLQRLKGYSETGDPQPFFPASRGEGR